MNSTHTPATWTDGDSVRATAERVRSLRAENAMLLQALVSLIAAGESHMSFHPSEGAAFTQSNADFYRALDSARAALKVVIA